MTFINLTPHDIVLNDGTVYPSRGTVRLTDNYTDFDVDCICDVDHGAVSGLPSPKPSTCYIVSTLVLDAAKKAGRTDFVAPATGHPQCKRSNGNIISVPGFIR